MRVYAGEIPTRLNETKKQVAWAMADRLITDTPVDTSRAESNWQIGLGSPVPNEIPPHFPGEHGSTDAQSQAEARNLAQQRIVQSKPGEPLYLSNATPYIVKLDQGSSMQAPAGFTHTALAIGRRLAQALGLQRGRAD